MRNLLTIAVVAATMFVSQAGQASKEGEENTIALTLIAADWLGTRNMASQPIHGWTYFDEVGAHVWVEQWHEKNPILGRHPSVGEVDTYFLASIAAYLLVQELLPEPWDGLFRRGTIILEFSSTLSQLGVGIEF